MTKEELKQEAEEWLCNNLHSASEEDFIKAMVDFTEPREKQIQIDAEQIRALQKQNGELTDELTKKADTNHQLVEQMAKLSEKNAELKEKLERAERARDYWKDSSFDWRHKCTSRRPFRVAVKAQKQLTKAKEIIREFVEWATWQRSNCPNFKSIQDKAEQFIKDSEVEK